LIGPPGRVLIPLVALAGLLILNDRSLPGGGSGGAMLLGFALAFSAVVVWSARFIVGALRPDGRRGLRRHWIRWLAAPLMGVTVIGLLYFNVPSPARFALSEPSLERFARQISATGETTEHPDRRIGLYALTQIERIEGGARFLVSGTGFLNSHGFAWSPKGMPEVESHTDYIHIRGPWYEWVSRW
jgi:hypothetical protein